MDILKQGRKLKGSNIWINEEIFKRTLDMRKKKFAEIKRRKENGMQGIFLKYKTMKQFKVTMQYVNDVSTKDIHNYSTERAD